MAASQARTDARPDGSKATRQPRAGTFNNCGCGTRRSPLLTPVSIAELQSGYREQLVASGFPTDFKELVRSRTNLVDLIAERVALQPRRGGREFVGLCPFHDDHNPSLTVSPERQSYKCWSCGAGGDCYTFVMETDKIGFREALEMLAQRANVEIPKTYRAASPELRDQRQLACEILAWAENEFHTCLLKSPEAAAAREYLAGRGFTMETIGRFRLGYHPAQREWLQQRARGKFTPAQLLQAGLVTEPREQTHYQGRTALIDRFINRVVFPIRDGRGRTVAFGGRILPGHPNPDAPKYWNSLESELFRKSQILFGFDIAREGMRRSETAVVVEGYTDCILAHQHGLNNAVAVMGTALTEAHVVQLKRFVRRVVLLLDSDAAGERATLRSLPTLLAHEVDLRILTLPSGLDPADFLQQFGADALREQLDDAVEAWEHKLRLSVGQYGLDSIDARHRVLDDMLELISHDPRLAGTARENLILNTLAQRCLLDERSVRQRLKGIRQKRAGKAVSVAAGAPQGNGAAPPLLNPKSRDDLLEAELLEIVFAAPETVETIRREVGPDDFRNEHLRKLLQICFDLAEAGETPSFEHVTSALEDRDLKRLAVMIDGASREKKIPQKLQDAVPGTGPGGRPGFLDAALRHLKQRRELEGYEVLKGRMAQQLSPAGGLDEDARRLLQQSMQVHKKRTAWKRSK